MATTKARNQGKTEFVKEVLGGNPHANTTTVNEAWTAAGRDGSISATLVNKQRSSLGLAGNMRSKSKKKTDPSPIEKPPYTGKKRGRKPKKMTTETVVFAPSSANGRKTEHVTNRVEHRGRANRRHGSLEEVEADIDQLLFKVMRLGGLPAVEESLRRTRRLLYGGFAV
jgi:hypothetical protein